MVLVGPDGVGKTTLAMALLGLWPAERRYFHFRPPVFRSMLQSPPRDSELVVPKRDRHGSRVLGWLRILNNLVRFSAGYVLSIQPALRRGALVVGDRWVYGYLVTPHQLQYYGPQWLARRVVSILPQPDLVVCLTAPPGVVVARKPELTTAEIESEDRLWRSLPVKRQAVICALDAPENLAAEVLSCL